MPFGLGLALIILASLPLTDPARWTAPYLVTTAALCLSFVGWSLAARAFERRRGEDGRAVPAILRQALVRIVAPMSIGSVALSLTSSVLLGYGMAALMLVVANIVLARMRRVDA